jgi:drug/metabolite transporter (DMT)-like permease
MPSWRLRLLSGLTLCCFAGNSLLARAALGAGAAGAASFTALRLISGAGVLWILSRGRPPAGAEVGWPSALALFLYAAPFSWAYLHISAGMGALLLFGAVQATMVGAALAHGERLRAPTWAGMAVALAGLATLALPGAQAPSPGAAAAMIVAGVAWGGYSIRGRGARDGISATADAFRRSAPLAAAIWIAAILWAPRAALLTGRGALLAVASGAVASGLGYSMWNSVLPRLRPSTAAVLQLSVPALAASGGIILLGERPTARLVLGGAAILGGIALAIIRIPPLAKAPGAGAAPPERPVRS